MHKVFIVIILMFVAYSSRAQMFPHKKPSQNKIWVDSMQRIIGKGFELNVKDKNNWKKQLAYVKNCTLLGRYLEWAYDKHYEKNMKLALKYYKLVTDLPRFPDDDKYFKALAIRTNINRKLEDIYFKGKGVKKNRKLSLEYALEGIGLNSNLIDFYAKRYYGNTSRMIFATKDKFAMSDSVFIFKAVPFVAHFGISNSTFNALDDKFKMISEIFKNRLTNDSVNILLEFYCETSLRSQANANYNLINLANKLRDKFKINADLIITNIEVENINDTLFTIFIQKSNVKI